MHQLKAVKEMKQMMKQMKYKFINLMKAFKMICFEDIKWFFTFILVAWKIIEIFPFFF